MTKEMDMDGNGKMNWFFNEWVYGTQIPNYKLDYRFEPADGGKVKLVAKSPRATLTTRSRCEYRFILITMVSFGDWPQLASTATARRMNSR